MAFELSDIPERTLRPRKNGLTMVMDKGVSCREAQYILEGNAPYIDIIKLGFGTSYVTPNVQAKVDFYKAQGKIVYLGGTLFEAFVYRNQFEDYKKVCRELGIQYFEVSDGSINLPHEQKCHYITQLAQIGTVFSEVGSKDVNNIMPPYKWIELMNAELAAGASYVIAEAREAGNVGVYRSSGEVRQGLVQEILTKIPAEKIIWEAPKKEQQLYFLNLLGCNVNLGNIAFQEVIALETMRIGLRGDSFFLYMKE